MNNQILINVTPQETRVCLIERNAVQELHIERTFNLGIVGNIYQGKITRVLPGMQAAFFDIGMNRTAFLHANDMLGAGTESVLPIEKYLYPGQTLMVQVIKDPMGTKGARLTSKLSIAGRLLVFLPLEKHLGVSQRIVEESEREQLKSRISQLFNAFPEAQQSGLIIRTEAQSASDDELLHDINYLINTWRAIKNKNQANTQLLYEDLHLAERMLRDCVTDKIKLIQVDSTEKFNQLKNFAQTYMPDVVSRLSHYKGERPIFDLFSIEEEIARSLERRVELKSGGYLIIDQTEAMTTIDVNTGAFVGNKNLADTVYKTNLEAAHTITRQLRLRNLGGIIILDFIDMTDLEHRKHVLSELKNELRQDYARISISDFSALGLIELTRKRTRESLNHQLCTTCPCCQGRGQVKSVRTICYEILREIVRESKQFDPQGFRLVASSSVIDAFLEEEAQYFAMLVEFVGKNITLHTENSYTQEQYDIVLI